MTINAVPERDAPLTDDDASERRRFTQPWLEFLRSVFFALFGWKRTFSGTISWSAGLIGAGSQATTAVTVKGARAGDAVIVSSQVQVAGLISDGNVTSNDTVTIRRINYSAAGINPGSDNYRIICLQQ